MDIALARILLSIVFGIGIGLAIAWLYRKEDAAHGRAGDSSAAFQAKAHVPAQTWVFFALLLGMLIAGTLQVGLLTQSYATFALPSPWAPRL
jgi:hypothetical protein